MCIFSREHSDHSTNSSTAEVKPNSSPDHFAPSGPVALVTTASSRANNKPADGNVAMKTEGDQRTEGEEEEDLRGEAFCLLLEILV